MLTRFRCVVMAPFVAARSAHTPCVVLDVQCRLLHVHGPRELYPGSALQIADARANKNGPHHSVFGVRKDKEFLESKRIGLPTAKGAGPYVLLLHLFILLLFLLLQLDAVVVEVCCLPSRPMMHMWARS